MDGGGNSACRTWLEVLTVLLKSASSAASHSSSNDGRSAGQYPWRRARGLSHSWFAEDQKSWQERATHWRHTSDGRHQAREYGAHATRTTPARKSSPAIGHVGWQRDHFRCSHPASSCSCCKLLQVAVAALRQCAVVCCPWTQSRSTCCSLDLSCSGWPISARCQVPQAGTPHCWQGWWRTYRQHICTTSFPVRQQRGLQLWQRRQLVRWLNLGWCLQWCRAVWTVHLQIQCNGNDYWRNQPASCRYGAGCPAEPVYVVMLNVVVCQMLMKSPVIWRRHMVQWRAGWRRCWGDEWLWQWSNQSVGMRTGHCTAA